MTTTMTVMPAGDAGVPAGDGGRGDGWAAAARCKRSGCPAPLPPAERGRSRQFCSDECRRRHYNALRGTVPAAQAAPAPDGAPAVLARLAQLTGEASRLAAQ